MFSFRKEFSETFCKRIYLGFQPQIPEHVFRKTVSSAVPVPQ